MQTQVYCNHLKKDVYFIVERTPFFKVSLYDAKTDEFILTVTIPEQTGRINCGYVDMVTHPWLFDFLERSRLAKPTHRSLQKKWGDPVCAEFEFNVDRINGNYAPIPNERPNTVIPRRENPNMSTYDASSKQQKKSKYSVFICF